MKKLFTLCFLLSPLLLFAQSGGKFGFQYDLTPTVSINGHALLSPWAGGINAPQFSTIRLNDDARDDLVVFDRTTDKVTTFIAIDNPTGSGTVWQYAPEYETAFPTGSYGWMLLVDYDLDGRKDIFTGAIGAVRVFHNDSQSGKLAFSVVADPLMTVGFGGYQALYVSNVDIPAITDFDDDGDTDIITFDADGNIIAYQQNMSVEKNGTKGGLVFQRTGGACWGHFRKEYCNDFTFDFFCDQSTSTGSGRVGTNSVLAKATNVTPSGARPMHTGNTLTVVDTDGDGNKDLLFGFVTCENLARIQSTGPNSASANFSRYDSLFPAANPILFPAFPVAFWEDVDGDGQKDLLASANVSSNDGYAYDFQASGWFYKNTGTTQKPSFQLIQKDFLQSDMLDLGERAAPALADLDGDGDLDLLVGYNGIGLGSNYRAGIWQFENKGTTQNPAFVLVTTDYLSLSQSLTLTGTVPSFVDLDANGSLDLVLTGIGAQGQTTRVFINSAAKGAAVQYNLASAVLWTLPSEVGVYDIVTVADVDGDSKPDLLIGAYSFGTILYYRNTGTATKPNFQLQNQTFGGFTYAQDTYVYARARSIVVSDLNGDKTNELILAADNGTVRIYQFPNPLTQTLTLIDSLPSIGLPGAGLIATVGDLNGDQLPDLMLGSRTGGIRYLKNTSVKVVVTGVTEETTGPWVYPNPTDRFLTVRPPFSGTIEFISLSGQHVLPSQQVKTETDTVIDLGTVADGTYLLRLSGDNHSAQVQKVVIWK